jgi:hypothetical protein
MFDFSVKLPVVLRDRSHMYYNYLNVMYVPDKIRIHDFWSPNKTRIKQICGLW